MANWPRRCWSPAARTEPRVALLLLLAAGVARAESAQTAPLPPASAREVLCVASDQGFLRARLRGAFDADLAWSTPQPQCRGALRPGGNGVRLLFKGRAMPRGEALTIVLGAGPLRAGQQARQVPVNLTVIRDGTGQFFATQGDDKCTFDEVHQTALDAARGLYRLEARGYCSQPARALAGDAALLLSRFDLQAIVDFTPPEVAPAAPERKPPQRDPDATST